MCNTKTADIEATLAQLHALAAAGAQLGRLAAVSYTHLDVYKRQVLKRMASEIAAIHALGVEVAIVVGGGNIWRGITGSEGGMDRRCV